MKISRADSRSISQVAFFLSQAIHEARWQDQFRAGRFLGMAEVAAAQLDNEAARARADELVRIWSATIENALKLQLPLTFSLAA